MIILPIRLLLRTSFQTKTIDQLIIGGRTFLTFTYILIALHTSSLFTSIAFHGFIVVLVKFRAFLKTNSLTHEMVLHALYTF